MSLSTRNPVWLPPASRRIRLLAAQFRRGGRLRVDAGEPRGGGVSHRGGREGRAHTGRIGKEGGLCGTLTIRLGEAPSGHCGLRHKWRALVGARLTYVGPMKAYQSATFLRLQAKELLDRASGTKANTTRKQLELWAQELKEKAEQVERQARAGSNIN
jgi:hypothetical protein